MSRRNKQSREWSKKDRLLLKLFIYDGVVAAASESLGSQKSNAWISGAESMGANVKESEGNRAGSELDLQHVIIVIIATIIIIIIICSGWINNFVQTNVIIIISFFVFISFGVGLHFSPSTSQFFPRLFFYFLLLFRFGWFSPFHLVGGARLVCVWRMKMAIIDFK